MQNESPLLIEAQLITPPGDALKQRRTTFLVAEPVLRLHQLVAAPNEARLARHQGAKVWSEVTDTVAALIYGPHFEYLARTWCAEHASAAGRHYQPDRTDGHRVSVVTSS